MKRVSPILPREEIVYLFNAINDAYEAKPILDQHLEVIIAELRVKLDVFRLANKHSFSSVIIDKLDTERDLRWNDLIMVVQGFQHSYLPKLQTAARKVSTILEHYGSAITRESYDTQTKLMDEALAKLASPEMVKHIAKLPGVEDLVAHINEVQDTFHEEMAKNGYKDEPAATLPSAKPKKEFIAFVNDKLIPYLEVMMNFSEEFWVLCEKVEKAIEHVNKSLSHRLWH